MLSQDPLILRQLGERQRYLPPVLAFSGYLAISTAVQVCHDRLLSSHMHGVLSRPVWHSNCQYGSLNCRCRRLSGCHQHEQSSWRAEPGCAA